MVSKELGSVEIALPFTKKTWLGNKTVEKTVGFRFNTLSWYIMCELFEPAIEFHQIDELQKSQGSEVFEKIVLAGALSYHFKYKNNPVITANDVHYWLHGIQADRRDKIVSTLQVTILNSKIMGKSMTALISESETGGEKKN
jgi:hypothetical protein